MKKVFLYMAALLLILMPMHTANAASAFSLTQGALAESDKEYSLLSEFFKGMQISSGYSGENDKYQISGTNSAQSKETQNGITYTDECNGGITGEFDPATGVFQGRFDYKQTDTGKDSSTGITVPYVLFNVVCHFTGSARPGDTTVKLNFRGTNALLEGHTKYFEINVTFTIEGELPFPEGGIATATPQQEETPTLEELMARVKTPARDSGIRFSDLAGQVEVCIPLGYDANGKEVYDDEAWTYAKLNMVLPYGSKIKVSEKSAMYLSYPDMTVVSSDKESIIILNIDPQVDPKRQTEMQLLWGNLKANVKKMMKDGSMQVEMSQAVAGIKGTTFIMEEDGAKSTLKVMDGVVEFTSKATGQSIMVNAGEMMSATASGFDPKQRFDAAAENAKWNTADIGKETSASEADMGLPLWALIVIIIAAVLVAAGTVAIITVSVKKRKHAPAQSFQNANGNKTHTIEERLDELKSLKTQGLITDAEYAEKRKRIINSI